MAIKLVIRNRLEDELYADVYSFPNGIGKEMVEERIRRIKPYDEEKWKDGKIYEFNTLKEIAEFYDSCDREIEFTDEYASKEFGEWDWEEIDIDYVISKEEDNMINLYIDTHREWRD